MEEQAENVNANVKFNIDELKAKLAAQRIIDKMMLQDVYGLDDKKIYPV